MLKVNQFLFTISKDSFKAITINNIMLLLSTNNSTESDCKLLGSAFEDGIQFILGILAFLSLLIKWKCEKYTECRTFKTFMLDGTKQGISALFAHGANMLIAIKLSKVVVNTNECAWYFISFTFDTLVGVGIAYLLLRLVTHIAKKKKWNRLIESGNYREEESNKEVAKTWGIQTLSWLFVTFVSRFIIGFILWAGRDGFSKIADGVASCFDNNPKGLLVFVMIICPGIMNIIQIWIQDQILKKKKVHRGILDHQLINNDGIGNEDL